MLDTSRTWILLAIVFALGIVCYSQSVSPSACSVVEPAVKNASYLAKIPPSCCTNTSNKCLSDHNGICQMEWLTGSCDYTIDVCSSRWYCTCCGSCNETKTNSQCKKAGGRCSKNCNSNEYHAGWISCHNGCCKCCKNKCDGTTCDKGKGYCSSTGSCKTGYSPSKTATCQGFNCTCCIQ